MGTVVGRMVGDLLGEADRFLCPVLRRLVAVVAVVRGRVCRLAAAGVVALTWARHQWDDVWGVRGRHRAAGSVLLPFDPLLTAVL